MKGDLGKLAAIGAIRKVWAEWNVATKGLAGHKGKRTI